MVAHHFWNSLLCYRLLCKLWAIIWFIWITSYNSVWLSRIISLNRISDRKKLEIDLILATEYWTRIINFEALIAHFFGLFNS